MQNRRGEIISLVVMIGSQKRYFGVQKPLCKAHIFLKASQFLKILTLKGVHVSLTSIADHSYNIDTGSKPECPSSSKWTG